MSFLFRLNFLLRKPKAIVIIGDESGLIRQSVLRILRRHLKYHEYFVFNAELDKPDNTENLRFLIKNSSLFVMVLSSFNPENAAVLKKLANYISGKGILAVCFDDEATKKIGEEADLSPHKIISFGFNEGADFQASDIKANGIINFKINYQGSSVPVWLDKKSDEKTLYSALAAACACAALGLNLVEISQSFWPEK